MPPDLRIRPAFWFAGPRHQHHGRVALHLEHASGSVIDLAAVLPDLASAGPDNASLVVERAGQALVLRADQVHHPIRGDGHDRGAPDPSARPGHRAVDCAGARHEAPPPPSSRFSDWISPSKVITPSAASRFSPHL